MQKGLKQRKVVRRFRSDVTLYEDGIRIKDMDFEKKDILGSQITDPRGEWAEEWVSPKTRLQRAD